MKITLNGTKVRAYKGVDKRGRTYQFIVVGGRTDDKDNKPVRVIFNNKGLYEAIASATDSVLDTVEVEASATRERVFTGRDGLPVTVIETVDPLPTGVERSAFPAKYPWPTWGDLMAEAAAPASADAPAAEDSEAEF